MRLLLEDFDVGKHLSVKSKWTVVRFWLKKVLQVEFMATAISSRSALKNNSQLRRWLWTPAKFGSLSMQAAKNGETDACADLDRIIVAQRFTLVCFEVAQTLQRYIEEGSTKVLICKQSCSYVCRIACVASSAANQDNTLTSRRNFSEPGESMIFSAVSSVKLWSTNIY